MTCSKRERRVTLLDFTAAVRHQLVSTAIDIFGLKMSAISAI